MKRKHYYLWALLMLALWGAGLSHAQDSSPDQDSLKVAALHPILGDLARRIGGEHVEVVDLLKPNGNLHAFDPTSDDLRQASKANMILASGKKIEPYLTKLKDSLSPGCLLIDVGQSIPDVLVSPENEEAACCPDHSHAGHDHGDDHQPIMDPHWWHSMENIKRATSVIEQAFAKKAPVHAKEFAANKIKVEKECDKLTAWGKRQLMGIPQERRVLIIGHAAFGHLCKELNFKQIAIQGSSREDEGTARHLAESLKKMREQKAIAVFPEYQSNPKVLEEIAKSLSLKMGKPLVSDGTAPEAHTFDTMFRYNITAITEALSEKKKP